MSSERAWPRVSRLVFGAVLSGSLVVQAATTEAGFLDASWNAPTTNTDGSELADLSSYRVYFGTSSAPCPGSSSVAVPSPRSRPEPGDQASVRLSGLATGATYHVSVTAVDAAGNQSACSGVASAPARADFSVNPSGTVSFGSVNLGSSADRIFTVLNTEGGVLSGSVSLAAPAGNGANPFRIVSGNSINNLSAAAPQNVTVRFTPSTNTTVSTNLIFVVGGGTISAIVTGTGTGAGTDTARPTVTITSPTSVETHTISATSLSLAGTASDNVGVAEVSWTNDRGGSGIARGTSQWSAAGIRLQNGKNLITVTARDTAGNTGTDMLTVTSTPVVPDTTPPLVVIVDPIATTVSPANVSPLTLRGTARDDIAVTQVTWSNSLGGSGTAAGTASWTASGIALKVGSNTITVTARDAAGNRGSASVKLAVENTSPDDDDRRPGISRVRVSEVTTSQARISWRTDEASDSQVEYGRRFNRNRTPLDGSLVMSHAQVLSGLAPNTWYHFKVRSRDAAGNLRVSREFWFRTDGRDRR
jgi:Purple acid Phosphatase, N-terminal domain/HYR domain